MKRWATILLTLSPISATGESQIYDVSVALTTHDVRAYLSLLNEQLGLRLPTKALSDYSASLATDNTFSEGIDVHFRGVVRTVNYRIKKSADSEISFSFLTSNKELASAICKEMYAYSQVRESVRALTNCKTDLLDTVKV